jgi:hypothetical protein
VENGGEMTQTLYAHMNKIFKILKKGVGGRQVESNYKVKRHVYEEAVRRWSPQTTSKPKDIRGGGTRKIQFYDKRRPAHCHSHVIEC